MTIQNRIKKLLALSESSNKHEAVAAMVKAQELLAEHEMTIEQVDVGKERAEPVYAEVLQAGRVPLWKLEITTVIAENFRCYAVHNRTRNHKKTTIEIFGLPQDATIARAVSAFAVAVGEQCWSIYRQTLESAGVRGYTEAIKADYFKGFVDGAARAFRHQVREKEIVLVKDALVEARVEAEMNTFEPKDSRCYAGDPAAYTQGRNDAESLKEQYETPRLEADVI